MSNRTCFVSTSEGLDRRYYELCVLSELKNALRSVDIWVLDSRQFKDFREYLLPADTVAALKRTNYLPLAVATDCEQYLSERILLLEQKLKAVNLRAAANELPDATITDAGGLKVTPLDADMPAAAQTVIDQTAMLLPHVKITELLQEADKWTGFTRHSTHLKTGEQVKDKVLLLSAILTDGTTSSSDGQRFRVGGKADSTGHVNPKFGSEPGRLFYTHISDQYTPFSGKVINVGIRDSTYVLDPLLYPESDLRIEEHYTDTSGVTDHVFALMHLLGFRFAPRIRDLANTRLYAVEKPSSYATLAPLIGGAVNTKQIAAHWNEILRLATSITHGSIAPLNLLIHYCRWRHVRIARPDECTQ